MIAPSCRFRALTRPPPSVDSGLRGRRSVPPLRDADTQVLGAMLGRRRHVIAILVAEKTRLGRALREVRPRIEAHINLVFLRRGPVSPGTSW